MKRAFSRLPEGKQSFILDAAIATFAAKGFDGAGIADLCAAAGISNGALYKYFDNKDDLFLAVVERGSELIEAVYGEIPLSLSPRAYFRELLEKIRSFPQAHLSAVSLYIECGTPALNRFAEGFAAALEPRGIEHLRSYLRGAQARGDVRSGLDIDAALFAIDSVIVLYAFSCVSQYHEYRLRSFIDAGRPGLRVPTEDEKIEYLLRAIETLIS
jgi:TetR/AcrR family transcriptional regulator